MNPHKWNASGEHPDSMELFRYHEGELAQADRQEVKTHLSTCWQCQSHLAQLRESITAFIELRAHAQMRIPNPPRGWKAFEKQLASLANQPSPGEQSFRFGSALWAKSRDLLKPHLAKRWHRGICFLPPLETRFRPHAIAGLATVLALVLAFGPFFNTTPLSAAVLLDRATVASREFKSKQKRGIVQRVLIRKGEHTVIRSLAPGHVRDIEASSAEVQLRKILNDAGLNWEDPLDPGFYSTWRSSLLRRREEVKNTESRYIISTEDLSQGSIERASISISSDSWLPQSETFYLRGDGEPITIEKLAAAVSLETSDAASQIQQHSLAAERLRRPREETPAPEPMSPPTPEELELAEANARVILRKIDADIREVPDIVVTSERVIIDTALFSPERREVLFAAIADMPWVSEQELGAHLATESLVRSDQARAETHPPFKGELAAFAGSDILGTTYLSKVRSALDVMLTHSLALNRLATQYPRSRYGMLPPEARRKIDGLADFHLAMIYHSSPSLQADAGPLLLSIASRHGIAPPMRLSQSACVEWIDASPQLESVLRSLDRSLSRMFSAYESIEAEPLDSHRLLRTALESHDSPLLSPAAVCQITTEW